jgi:hypothetical protein
MKDSRIGEHLWYEWAGNGFNSTSSSPIVFYTVTHVDVEHEVVERALASTLQRDGIVSRLSDGYNAIKTASISYGYAGEVDEEIYLTVCDVHGETYFGDIVDKVFPITWVEIYVGTN